MEYKIVGVANTPTAFANSTTGASSTAIQVMLGGDTTDTDVALGRTKSEAIVYYIIETLSISNANASYGFVDAMLNPVGLPGSGGTWLLSQADIANLYVYIDASNVTVEFRSTTVVIEEGGDLAFDGANFTVYAERIGVGGNDTTPLPPIASGATASGDEDGEAVLVMTIMKNTTDTSNPALSVEIFDLPPGSTVESASFNPLNMRWIASAANVIAGMVKIIPPADLGDADGSTVKFKVQGVASNAIYRAETAEMEVDLILNPMADGVDISVSAIGATDEDTEFGLNISMTLLDVDGSETYGPYRFGPYYFYMSLPAGVTISGLSGPYPLVLGNETDGQFAIKNLVGYYRIPMADNATIRLTPPVNFHGPLTFTIVGTSVEPTDNPMDPDHLAITSKNITFNINAVADPPTVTVPLTVVTGSSISFFSIPNLTVALVDTVTVNGAEAVTSVLSGLPKGTILNAGFNSGLQLDGLYAWTIPVTSLPTLQMLPPEGYGGLLNLTLTGISIESSNGNEASTSVPFLLNIPPLADNFLMLIRDATIPASGVVTLDANVRLVDNRGNETVNEIAGETVILTFSNVPTGVSLRAPKGGSVDAGGTGIYIFTGSQDQANALQMIAGPNVVPIADPSFYSIAVSGVTRDGTNVLAQAVLDSFRLYIDVQDNAGLLLPSGGTGGPGNDVFTAPTSGQTMNGGAGIDRLTSGPGTDMMTGGPGGDIFVWEALSSLDSITDFMNTPDGDQLDLSLMFATPFNRQTSDVNDYVSLSTGGSGTTVMVDVTGTGSFQPLVVLLGVSGLNVETMLAAGNLVL
jgi:hypothetical protein